MVMVNGGAGWELDSATLRPVITDEHVFRSRYANDPALEVLVALWTGDPDQALARLQPLLDAAPTNWRWRALRADARRDLGDHVDAIADYRQLVSEHAGTTHEAVLVQHLGKAYFAAEDYTSAATCFERALALREAGGADSSLVESSRTALERASQLAARRDASNPHPGEQRPI
jgi:tetratricopeptide (TPR) repeat protein